MSGYLSRLARRATGDAPTPRAPRLPERAPVGVPAPGRPTAAARPAEGRVSAALPGTGLPPVDLVRAHPGSRDPGTPSARRPGSTGNAEVTAASPRGARTSRTDDDSSRTEAVARPGAAPVPAPAAPVRPEPQRAGPPATDRGATLSPSAPAPTVAEPTRVVPTGPPAPPPTHPPRRAVADTMPLPPPTVREVEVVPPRRGSDQDSAGRQATEVSHVPTVSPVSAVPPRLERPAAQPVTRPRTAPAEQAPATRNAVQVHIGTIEIQGPPAAAPEPAPPPPPQQPAAPARGAFEEFVGLRTYTPWRW